jgi:hypothetical protein
MPGALDLLHTYVVHVAGQDAAGAARRLRAVPGVRYALPDLPVGSMAIEPQPLSRAHVEAGNRRAATIPPPSGSPALPTNYGLQSSLQSYLNSTGVNAVGAFVELAERYGQLPGEGTRITNVSIGDRH